MSQTIVPDKIYLVKNWLRGRHLLTLREQITNGVPFVKQRGDSSVASFVYAFKGLVDSGLISRDQIDNWDVTKAGLTARKYAQHIESQLRTKVNAVRIDTSTFKENKPFVSYEGPGTWLFLGRDIRLKFESDLEISVSEGDLLIVKDESIFGARSVSDDAYIVSFLDVIF